jgi:hypothetical protein
LICALLGKLGAAAPTHIGIPKISAHTRAAEVEYFMGLFSVGKRKEGTARHTAAQ